MTLSLFMRMRPFGTDPPAGDGSCARAHVMSRLPREKRAGAERAGGHASGGSQRPNGRKSGSDRRPKERCDRQATRHGIWKQLQKRCAGRCGKLDAGLPGRAVAQAVCAGEAVVGGLTDTALRGRQTPIGSGCNFSLQGYARQLANVHAYGRCPIEGQSVEDGDQHQNNYRDKVAHGAPTSMKIDNFWYHRDHESVIVGTLTAILEEVVHQKNGCDGALAEQHSNHQKVVYIRPDAKASWRRRAS